MVHSIYIIVEGLAESPRPPFIVRGRDYFLARLGCKQNNEEKLGWVSESAVGGGCCCAFLHFVDMCGFLCTLLAEPGLMLHMMHRSIEIRIYSHRGYEVVQDDYIDPIPSFLSIIPKANKASSILALGVLDTRYKAVSRQRDTELPQKLASRL
jgi:hypothetical protein